MCRLSRWSSFIQVWKEILLFLKSDQDQTLRVSGHVSVDRVIQGLPTVFGRPGGDSNHFQGTMVMLWRSGTLWGLAAGVLTSMVMNRAAKKTWFFFETYIHSHPTDASSDVEPESNLTFPSAFDSYFFLAGVEYVSTAEMVRAGHPWSFQLHS